MYCPRYFTACQVPERDFNPSDGAGRGIILLNSQMCPSQQHKWYYKMVLF